MHEQRVSTPEGDVLRRHLAAKGQVDDYTLRFWYASLEASWQGTSLNDRWDPDKLDWVYLVWAGTFHRLLEGFGRIWGQIQGIPEAVADDLWMAREIARHHGKAVVSGIHDLQDIASKHSIRLAIMKSPCYVLDAFSGFEDRKVMDVDVLVLAGDFEPVSAILHQLGYQSQKHRYDTIFFNGKSTIEIHRAATNRRRFFKLLSTGQILDRAEIDPRWQPLLRLSTTDEALVLVLHAFHHFYRQALWIRDLAAWWKVRNPEPDEILAAFRRLGLSRTGWVAWRGAERMGWRMPKSWRPRLWSCSPGFDRFVGLYWDHNVRQKEESYHFILMQRWLEFRQAQGIKSKLRSLSPCFSKRNLCELYRVWRRRDHGTPATGRT